MKSKKSFATKIMLAVTSVAMLAASCMFAACDDTRGGGTDPTITPTPAIDKNENITSVYGTYTRFVGYDDLKDVFTTGITAYGTDDSNFFENDTLALFNTKVDRHENNAYIWDGGDRYVYTRHLQLTTCGLSFWQQYIGHFTWDEGTRNITLGFPEMFSYSYFFGDASGALFTDFGAANVFVDVSEEAFADGTVRLDERGRYLFVQEEYGYAIDSRHASGYYSFNYQIADYHNGAASVGPMDMVLDLNTMTYAFPDLDA